MESISSKCSADGRVVSTHKKQVISITINCLETQVLLHCHWQTPPQQRVSINQVGYCQPKCKLPRCGMCLFVKTACFPKAPLLVHSQGCGSAGRTVLALFCHPFRAGQGLLIWAAAFATVRTACSGPSLFLSLFLFTSLVWREPLIVSLLLLLPLQIKGTNEKGMESVSLSFPWNHL